MSERTPGNEVHDETAVAVYDPHPGVECCPCVERLRAQNKASADEWTKRTAEMQSDLDGLRSLMREAGDAHRKGHTGISAYGQAALAAALQVADEAEGKAEAYYHQMLRERRERIAVQRDLRVAREAIRGAVSGRTRASESGLGEDA